MRSYFFGFLGWLCLSAWVVSLSAVETLRLEDVIYLDDYLKENIKLKAIHSTRLTFSRDGSSLIGGIHEGQQVRLIGLSGERYLVRAQVSNGHAEGWVIANDLEPIPESVLKDLQLKITDVERLKQAVAKGQIELGMSQDSVVQILGKAKAKSSINEASGSSEQWTYTTYRSIPFYIPAVINGTNFVSTVYRKIPVGTKVVTFQDKKVVRFEEKQDDATQYKWGQTIVPPIIVR